jgi:integral membrane protein
MLSLLRFFRLSGTLEAVSYLILLLIAMPLKYIWHMPIFVRWTGLFHGVFFIVFSILVVVTGHYKKWPFKVTLLAFLSAFLPFGPLIFDRYFLPPTAAETLS